MKKLLALFSILLVVGLASNLPACEGPECQTITNADVSGNVYTPTLNYWTQSHNPNGEDYTNNYGWAGHSYDIEARGTYSAYAHGDGGEGNLGARGSKMKGLGKAFQKEINGGELSGAGALTIATSHVKGHAKGVDHPDCNTGADYAKVDLEVFGYSYQQNGAYSDDNNQAFIGGGNWSSVDFYAQTDRYDYGANYRVWDYGWYKNHRGDWRYGWHRDLVINLDAEARDELFGMGLAGGGTLVYARQVGNESMVKGITGSFSTAIFCGAEGSPIVNVNGGGMISGAANLPGSGYAAFGADYTYAGQNFGYGIAGGSANVTKAQTGNTTSVTSQATSFSKAFAGGGHRQPQ